MNKNEIESKRNELNLDIRGVLAIIDMIDGKTRKYEDYVENTLNENDFLDQQIKLTKEIKERLISIFKD